MATKSHIFNNCKDASSKSIYYLYIPEVVVKFQAKEDILTCFFHSESPSKACASGPPRDHQLVHSRSLVLHQPAQLPSVAQHIALSQPHLASPPISRPLRPSTPFHPFPRVSRPHLRHHQYHKPSPRRLSNAIPSAFQKVNTSSPETMSHSAHTTA